MTDAELSSLEAAARAATPGPWEISRDDFSLFIESRKGTVGEIGDAFDANYISAANPASILSLIAELRQAKAERNWLIMKTSECPYPNTTLCAIKSDKAKCVQCWRKAAKEAVCQK